MSDSSPVSAGVSDPDLIREALLAGIEALERAEAAEAREAAAVERAHKLEALLRDLFASIDVTEWPEWTELRAALAAVVEPPQIKPERPPEEVFEALRELHGVEPGEEKT
jgi:hypothetical protein